MNGFTLFYLVQIALALANFILIVRMSRRLCRVKQLETVLEDLVPERRRSVLPRTFRARPEPEPGTDPTIGFRDPCR